MAQNMKEIDRKYTDEKSTPSENEALISQLQVPVQPTHIACNQHITPIVYLHER